MMRLSQFRWVPRAGAKEAAYKMLQPAVRFPIEIDLPPCTTQQRDVELSESQAKAYRTLKRDCVLAYGEGKLVAAVNEAVLRIKLLQISCGAVYGPDRDVLELDAAPRLRVVKEIVEETERKVVIFAPLTSVISMLNRYLAAYKRAVIIGETTLRQRKEILDAFGRPDSDPRILIADPGTMAHGINDLVTASVTIWYAPVDRSETYQQANKRMDRPGQTAHTTIVQIAATSAEREMYKRLEHNQNMQGVMLKMFEEVDNEHSGGHRAVRQNPGPHQGPGDGARGGDQALQAGA